MQNERQNPIITLIHSESVASIKWRPKCRTQIAACSNNLISHLYVWDLNRPYVPYASFDSQLNKVKSKSQILIFSRFWRDQARKRFCEL